MYATFVTYKEDSISIRLLQGEHFCQRSMRGVCPRHPFGIARSHSRAGSVERRGRRTGGMRATDVAHT